MYYILASNSPRRRDLLNQIGLEFVIHPSCGEEVITKKIPADVVMELAEQKASEVFHDVRGVSQDYCVIGSDTIVAAHDQILGKPSSEEHAKEMLHMLQGESHQVYTGVCLMWKREGEISKAVFYESTDVLFYPMDEAEIEDYVASGDPMDKAGAYGIQGNCAKYVKGITGDYNNVVGLPVGRLYQEMKKNRLL